MRVILYGPDFNRRTEIGWRTTLALSEGLTSLGVEHSVLDSRRMAPGSDIPIADVCIVNGWLKHSNEGRGRITRNDIIRAQIIAGKPPWCIERAFLLDRDEWSAMSIGGFGANGGDFRAEGMPPDRWERLGIELQPWRAGGDYVLLCAQVPWDAQVQDGNHLEWLDWAVAEIRKHTDRRLVFRGHPKSWRRGRQYDALSRETKEALGNPDVRRPPADTFEEAVAGAHAVVCYNSNVAVLSNILGVPVFTGARCLADPIACRDWSRIEDPPRPDREQWAWDMAYKQWNVEEFRQALPWLHLTREVVTT